jgi:hypothetical protein
MSCHAELGSRKLSEEVTLKHNPATRHWTSPMSREECFRQGVVTQRPGSHALGDRQPVWWSRGERGRRWPGAWKVQVKPCDYSPATQAWGRIWSRAKSWIDMDF